MNCWDQSRDAGRYCFHFSRRESIMRANQGFARNRERRGIAPPWPRRPSRNPSSRCRPDPSPPIRACCARCRGRCITTSTPISSSSTRTSRQSRPRRCASSEPALILHCEPAPGIEAAAASLIAPDDVVLNLASGVYGKGFGYWSARYNKELVEIEVPYNEAIDPAAVADGLPQAAGHQGRLPRPSRHAVGHHQSGARDRQDRARRMTRC